MLVVVVLLVAAERTWVSQKSAAEGLQPAQATLKNPAEDRPGIQPLAPPRDKSIAVLPFEHTGDADRESQLFPDGIHGDLLTRLSGIHQLTVISRTSVMPFRDRDKDRSEIGRELGVSNLLEGSLEQTGDEFLLEIQLVDAASGSQVWAETFSANLTAGNIFRIQGEITRAVAQVLGTALSEGESRRLAITPTVNTEAYRAVLLSRQYQRRNGFDASRRSLQHARKAVALDSEYADAHVTLAQALITGIADGTLHRSETTDEPGAAIERALTLDPANPAAWSALGFYRSANRQPGFSEAFERALELAPNDAHTLTLYGDALTATDDPEKALGLLLKAVELDPLSAHALHALGRTHGKLGQFEAARSVYARIRETDPASPMGYAPTGMAYLGQGRLDLGLYWISQGQAIDPHDFELAAWMVSLYDSLDHHEGARTWSAWLDRWITKQPLPMAMQAKHHYLSGNFELALQYANLAINLDLDNGRNSEVLFMRLKRDEAIANGNPVPGIELFLERYPGLRARDPELSPDTVQQAVHLASLFSLNSEKERAALLLEAAIETYDRPYTIAGPAYLHLAPLKAEALALLGEKDAALAELRRVIDEGWRNDWRWSTDLNASFNGVRDTSEFRSMVQELAIDTAAQRIAVEDMEAEGKIGPPAKPDRNPEMETLRQYVK